MAIISMKNAQVGYANGSVTLRVPIDGRPRTLRLDAVDAVQIANQIATSALHIIPVAAPASMVAREIELLPYGAGGLAHLAVATEHGPFVFALDSVGLAALATAAEAALEFSDHRGTA